jgi:hypothetical protein
MSMLHSEDIFAHTLESPSVFKIDMLVPDGFLNLEKDKGKLEYYQLISDRYKAQIPDQAEVHS